MAYNPVPNIPELSSLPAWIFDSKPLFDPYAQARQIESEKLANESVKLANETRGPYNEQLVIDTKAKKKQLEDTEALDNIFKAAVESGQTPEEVAQALPDILAAQGRGTQAMKIYQQRAESNRKQAEAKRKSELAALSAISKMKNPTLAQIYANEAGVNIPASVYSSMGKSKEKDAKMLNMYIPIKDGQGNTIGFDPMMVPDTVEGRAEAFSQGAKLPEQIRLENSLRDKNDLFDDGWGNSGEAPSTPSGQVVVKVRKNRGAATGAPGAPRG